MNDVDSQFFGAKGVEYETGTTALTAKNYYAITTLTDTVFATLTNSLASGDAITGITIPAGVTLYGNFTAVTLTSGAIAGYKK